jgi:hypothetical protein
MPEVNTTPTPAPTMGFGTPGAVVNDSNSVPDQLQPRDMSQNTTQTPSHGEVPTQTSTTTDQNLSTLSPLARQNEEISKTPDRQMLPPNIHAKAKMFRGIADVLSPPMFKTVINPDGTSSQVRLPRSRADIGMAIAVAAMTGAFAGLGEKGPGATGRAAAAGFAAGGQQREQVSQQQSQAAQADFARKQATFDFNMRMMHAASEMGMMDKTDHDSFVSSWDHLVTNWSDLPNAGDIIKFGSKDAPLSEDESEDVKKHSPLDLMRIPVSTYPRLDKDGKQAWVDERNNIVSAGTPGAHPAWDNGYILVDKSAKVSLSDENGPTQTVKDLVAKYDGIIPGVNKSLIAGDGVKTQISAQSYGKMVLNANVLDTTQKSLNNFYKVLNEGKKPGDTSFIPPVDLKQAIKTGRVTLNDLQNLQNSAGNSSQGNSTVLNTQIDAIRQKDPRSAARLQSLFGEDDLETYKQKILARGKAEAAALEQQGKAMTEVVAKNYIAQNKANPGSVPAETLTRAHSILDQGIQESVDRVRLEEEEKQKIQEKQQNELHSYMLPPSDWSDADALKTRSMSMNDARKYLMSKGVKIPDNFATLYGIANNRDDISKAYTTRLSKGTGQTDHDTAFSYISTFLNPHFQAGDFSAGKKLSEELASSKMGTAGGSLLAAGTATQHIGSMVPAWKELDNGNVQAFNDWLNKAATALGKPAPEVSRLYASMVAAEVEKVVAGSTPHETRMQDLKQQLGVEKSPDQQMRIARTMIDLMHGRLDEINQREMQYHNRPAMGISPATSKMFLQLGMTAPWLDRPDAATFAVPDKKTGQLHWSDGSKDLGLINFEYWKNR